MPLEVIRPQLRTLTLGRLHDLKREWEMFMQALIERAHQARLLTATERTNLYKALSSRGWRTSEPVSDELPPETAELARNVGLALGAKGLSSDEIVRLAGFAPDKDNQLFRPDCRRLRAVRRQAAPAGPAPGRLAPATPPGAAALGPGSL